jgi:glycogen(starch) synthase
MIPPATPRRILMTADPIGGVWSYALELVRALDPHNTEVTLATMGAPLSRDQAAEAAAIANLDIHSHDFKLEWMDEPWRDVEQAGDWLLGIERHCQPDVIHLNGYAHGNLPWHAPVLMVAHSCVLSWWRAVKGHDAPERFAQYRNAVTSGIQAAERLVAPSHAMLEAICKHYGPLPSSEVIYNGREAKPRPTVAKENYIFAAGRFWDEAKNLALLEHVAPDLPWPVYIAGEIEPASGRRLRTSGCNYAPASRTLGKLSAPEMADWLSRAAIFVSPARYEPFGLSALEAGLAGCALVLGDIPSLREIWQNAAIFVSPTDTSALKAALNDVITDSTLRNEMSRRARLQAMTYTPGKMAARYVAAYARLLPQAAAKQRKSILCAS